MNLESLSTSEVRSLLDHPDEPTQELAYKELLARRENRERLMSTDYRKRIPLSGDLAFNSFGEVPL